jgi:hypothetical protein
LGEYFFALGNILFAGHLKYYRQRIEIGEREEKDIDSTGIFLTKLEKQKNHEDVIDFLSFLKDWKRGG